jgi:hypothetical protein
MELAMVVLLTDWGETWRDQPMLSGVAQQMPTSRRELVTNLIISHAYTEYGHVAQCFALPNSGATQHDAVIRGARTKNVSL